jgi:hypothetical protein
MLTLVAVVLTVAVFARSQEPAASSKPASDILNLDGDDREKVPAKADPVKVLSAALKDERLAPPTLLALRAACPERGRGAAPSGADDKDLLVLFEAFSRCGDKQLRLLATTTLVQIGGKAAKPALLERLNEDPAMIVRSEALIHLLVLGEISDDQLLTAMKLDDQSIQCIAAKSLLQRGRAKEATPVLQRLTKSKDIATACLSRLSLLAHDDESQRKPLMEIARDRKTSEDVLDLMLQQIAEEKVSSARDLVKAILGTEASGALTLQAYRTLAAVSPDSTGELVAAIKTTDDLVVRVRLMRSLAGRKQCAPALEKLAKADEKDIACVLARLELARANQDADKMGQALRQAIAMGHPVVVDYILWDASEDLDGRPEPTASTEPASRSQPATDASVKEARPLRRAPAKMLGAYVAPLLEFIDSVPTDPERMRPVHQLAAVAVTWLADCELKEAAAGLERIMSGKHSAILRAAAAGLGKSRNKELVCRLSRPLLQSAYRDLKEDAALNLGRWGDKDAMEFLDKIVADPSELPVLKALACWYSLKAQGRTMEAAKELAKDVK